VGGTTWNGTLYNYYSAGVTATQLIWDFGQTPERWRAASINREASEFSAHAAETQVVSTVRRAYFQARAQKDLVTVAAEAVANQQKHVAQTEGLVGQGLRPEIDRARALTDLANARVQLVSARNADANAHAVLAEAIGLPAGQGVEVGNDELGPLPEEDAPLTKLVETALQDRPEIASFQRQRQAQEALIRSNRGAYGPTLAAQAGASEAGIELNHLVPNWYVEGLLTWPIFQGGLTRGQVREAEATLGSLVAQEDSFRLGVRVDVEQAALAVQGAKANLAASHEALTNAREQLRLAEGRYAAGLGSAIELGDAQVAATQAAAQEVGNRYALATARATLAGALGRR
jgi:outer membrane protein